MNIDLKIGDIVLAGKFQNKKVKITSIEKNDIGQPTYNGGKPILKFRIEKLMPKTIKEGLKSKIQKQLKEDYDKYEKIRYYPESGLHPLVQERVHSAYARMEKIFPGLKDCTVVNEDHKVKLKFSYKGKTAKVKLDLNGDTGSKVEQAVKRVCSTPAKKGRILPGHNFR